MNRSIRMRRVVGSIGRGIARLLVVGVIASAAVGIHAHRALAAYSAHVNGTTLTITGDAASDKLALRLQSGTPSQLLIDVGDNGSTNFTFDRNTFDHISVAAGGGDDRVRIDDSNGVFTDVEQTTIGGGRGADTLLGGSFAEVMLGGRGADTVDPNRGNDVAFLGDGTDTFIWDPGDGSDVVEGQSGTDTLRFNGSGASEHVDLSSNGAGLRLFRDVAAVTMDANDLEKVDLRALGGADVATINDLTGTDVTSVAVDLAGILGGASGDGVADQVVVNGTGAADTVHVAGSSGKAQVDGLTAAVSVAHAEPAVDKLFVNGLRGNDTLESEPAVAKLVGVQVNGGDGVDTALAQGSNSANDFQISAAAPFVRVSADGGATFVESGTENLRVETFGGNDTVGAGFGLIGLTVILIDGGLGSDTLGGGDGSDVILGADGDDTVDGDRGEDLVLLGAGTDTFIWDPGDGSDVVEGQAGTDTMRFNGSGISEHIDLSSNGQRFRLFRDVAAVTMDANDVEKVDFRALGGADVTTVNDLTGTDVTAVAVDLAGIIDGSAGDGQADRVIVNATAGDDHIVVAGGASGVNVTGLAATVKIRHSEGANDRLEINTFAGTDTVDSSGLTAGVIQLFVDGAPA